MIIIQNAASIQYPNLSKAQAVEQLLSYILNSIVMDFHPEDLYVPAINNSDEVGFKKIDVAVPRTIASVFARHSVSSNKKSYSNLVYQIRKRIFEKYQLMHKSRTSEPASFDNSFGYPSQ